MATIVLHRRLLYATIIYRSLRIAAHSHRSTRICIGNIRTVVHLYRPNPRRASRRDGVNKTECPIRASRRDVVNETMRPGRARIRLRSRSAHSRCGDATTSEKTRVQLVVEHVGSLITWRTLCVQLHTHLFFRRNSLKNCDPVFSVFFFIGFETRTFEDDDAV